VTGSTVFGIGSVTKTFVAALALWLAQKGVLDLDAPAASWLPGAAIDGKITIRRLLNHTSGLFGVDENPTYVRATDREPHRRWTPRQTLRYVKRPYFAPGQGWHYSDTNYVLAGLIIERATASSVTAQMRSAFLEPLALSRTGLQPQANAPATAAHAHGDPQRSGAIHDLSRGMRWLPYDSVGSSEWTSGGMFSSAEDVARFGDALFTGKLVDPAAIKEMTDWITGITFESYFGYGLGIGKRFDRHAGGELWGSIGFVPGFKADLWHVPSRGRTVAVLANDQRIDTTAVADALLHQADARR
jgi:D-alanyl-D-alanine carboxypeptidase